MEFLLAIDIETTGLDPHHHEITQLAVILLDKRLNIIDSFNSLVRIKHPERGIEDGFNAFEYTGINPKELKKAPAPRTVVDKLTKFVKEKTGLKPEEFSKICLFGQNTKFDISFVVELFKKARRKYRFDFHDIDLVSAFTVYHLIRFDELPEQVTLKYICNHFQSVNPKPHDAVSDITVEIAMFKHLMEQLHGGKFCTPSRSHPAFTA